MAKKEQIVQKERTSKTSEQARIEEINHLQFKFNRDIFKKTKQEKKELKKLKLNLTEPFNNETIMQFNADSFHPRDNIKIQISHSQRKVQLQKLMINYGY